MNHLLFFLILIPSVLISQTDKELLKKGVDIEQYIPKGINVGSEAPIIKSLTVDGNDFYSKNVLEQQLIIIFYRGNWCPYCNRHLSNLNDSLKYIEQAGGKVLVVGPENFKNAEKTASKTEAAFTLIPDTTMQIMQDFDVVFKVTKKYQRKIKTFLFTDIASNNNQDEAKLPVPATFIIGKDGKVKWKHFDYDYTKRASAKDIIGALQK